MYLSDHVAGVPSKQHQPWDPPRDAHPTYIPSQGDTQSADVAVGKFWCVLVLPGTELVRSPVAKSFLQYSWVQKGERRLREPSNLWELVFYILCTMQQLAKLIYNIIITSTLTSLNSGFNVFFLICVLCLAFFPMSGFSQLGAIDNSSKLKCKNSVSL